MTTQSFLEKTGNPIIDLFDDEMKVKEIKRNIRKVWNEINKEIK